jgi:two-component system CheB/CheR fusion protein
MAVKKGKALPGAKRRAVVTEKSKKGEASKTSAVSNEGERQDVGFPVIGLGASAGGLEAFEQFFRNMPPDTGMTFVLVSHLDPEHASMLTELLQRVTQMPVVEAADQLRVKPGHVYVIPPNREMAIFHGVLQLSIPETPRGQRMPIDLFLRSLAEDQGENSIGVVLSGTGSDGTLGLRAIHGAGGVTFVQEPSTAKYDGMPASAVRSGLATYVLPVEKIPEQLMTCVKTFIVKKVGQVPPLPAATDGLSRILMALRSKTGHDFSLYRQSTIKRRIDRRMIVHNIEDANIYARYINEHTEEAQQLFKELLINVTSFFRDAEAFAVLKKEIFPRLFENKPENYIFRVWSPGCSTGEEAYSLAISFKEYMDDIKQEFKVTIFGTDIAEDAVAAARSGSYPFNIVNDVTPERLRRFFTREETGYRVKKDIREMVVFATQNVVKDPPFTKLDLVSCRNLLIYLEAELQNRLIPVFHYALNPGGMLFLSPSEGIGSFRDLFAPVSKKWRFFEVKASPASALRVRADSLPLNRAQTGSGLIDTAKIAKELNFAELAKRALLQFFAPSSVVTDEKGNILYVYGDTGKYLRPAPGHASLNIIEMAREGLQSKLRAGIHSAATQNKELALRNVQVKTDGGFSGVNLTIRPYTEPEAAQPLLIVCFQEKEVKSKGKTGRPDQAAKSGRLLRVQELERELAYTRENLQAVIEEMQASEEELKSMNEELQSTNEEIETSKEELQSVNEELMTVNAELQAKIEQMTKMQNDMRNILDNTNLGTIFLDSNLAIKRFTREAAAVFRLAASDVGRPLNDIKSNIVEEDPVADAQAVLDSLMPQEKQVRTTDQAWYLARIIPYRTIDNTIDGVVLTFTDITRLKEAEEEMQKAREYSENIVETVREPLIILDAGLKVVSASRSFYETFHVSPGETEGRQIYRLGESQWDIPRLRELLETILPGNASFDNYVVEHEFPGLGPRKMLLNARRVIGKNGETRLILLAMEDITDGRRDEK